MGLKECNITLDNQWAVYYPGQTINGFVDYVFDTPKRIRGITVKIKGEAEVKWYTTEKRQNAQGKFINYPIINHANEEYFDISYYLIGGNGGEMELPAGTHSYPFTCALPPVLPSSFEGEHGYVRYTVKVALDRPWKFNQETKMAFTVVTRVDLNTMAQARAPVDMHFVKHFCCCWCKSGPAIIDVGLPASGFCCGQTMPFDISVENGSNVDIDSVTLIFSKVATFHCNTPKPDSITSKVEIAKIVTDPVSAHRTVNWTKNLEIPSLPPSNFVNCRIIDIDYEIKVGINNSGWHFDKDTTCHVYIGTVPLIGLRLPLPAGRTARSEERVGVLPDVPQSKDALLLPDRSNPSDGAKSGLPPPYTPHAGGPSYPTAPYSDLPPPYSNPQASYSAEPSAPPMTNELAHQPVFRQTQFGTSSIHDSGDNQHTTISGNAYFAPVYPTYGFRL